MAKTTKSKPLPPSKHVVSQLELKALIQLQISANSLRKTLKELDEVNDYKERRIMDALDKGATVEPGEHSARLVTSPGVCRPQWKQLHVDHMATHGMDAKTAEAQAKAAYPASDVVKLVVA